MMRSKLFWSVVAVGLMTAASASAQTSTSARRCTTSNGVQTCTTVNEGANLNSRSTCQYYGNGDSNCATEDSGKKPPRGPAIESIAVDLGAEKAKGETRAKAGYRDPSARALGCGAGYRMTERDGCQAR